jgi:hypothetical protein
MSRRAPKGVSWVILVCIASFLAGTGCTYNVKIVSAKCKGPSFDVKEKVKVKKGLQIVAWSSDATNLGIAWKKENPFPNDVVCQGGSFCAALVPPTKEPGSYFYTITGTCNGARAEKDPQVEIIDY